MVNNSVQKISGLDKLFVGIILSIFGFIILHAPITVIVGSIYPEGYLFVKAWKEILMIAAYFLAIILMQRNGTWHILKNPWIIVPSTYILLHLLFVPFLFSNWNAVIAGLIIDLRYVAYFILVMIAIRLYPFLRKLFLRIFFAGALLVGFFAIAQAYFLPMDVLEYIGYNKNTIIPYLLVDDNPDYVRINSTLRGPNPLGSYAVIVLALLAAYWWRAGRKLNLSAKLIASLTAFGSAIALWFSYSRSALVAASAALGIVFLLTVGRRLHKWVWISLFVVAFGLAGGLYAARDTSFVSNVILHENKGTGGELTSNEGHLESLADGLDRMARQPLGAGIGSTGSASLFTDEPIIIENQYLLIAHEIGWLGLGLFLFIFLSILWFCWQQRQDWLALGVLASGVGLAIVGILLPVWVDDTVSIIWWGLAALVVGGAYGRTINKTSKRAA